MPQQTKNEVTDYTYDEHGRLTRKTTVTTTVTPPPPRPPVPVDPPDYD